MLQDIITSYGGIEVSAMDVYRDMFRLGEHYIQTENEPSGEFKANPLGYMKQYGASKGNYRIMFEDTFEEVLKELQEADFSILNGITYYGRKNTQEHASKMYALILDVDGVTDKGLNNFLYASFNKDYKYYPLPNYIILSGHGLHLYYIFEEPVPLYPNIKLQMKELKYSLTQKIWNKNVTELHNRVQYQGINQGFRVIGGRTKIDGVKVRAFRINEHPFSINQLNEYVPEDKRVDQDKIWKESKLTLAQAKKKYPEWYERRVIQGEAKGTWTCKPDLYYWWLRKIQNEDGGASFGHRYFCIMCLSIYAMKSGVDKEQLKEDAEALLPYMNGLNTEEPFTEQDVESAMECYDERYKTFPIDDIVKLTAITIEKNKRNGRKQKDHLKLMRFIRDELNGNIEWQNKDGRPTKEDVVRGYLQLNPDKSISEVARVLNVSRTTIYKYLDKNQKDC